MLPTVAGFIAVAAFAPVAFAQPEYRIYTDHPRLFLNEGRLSRLRKDVERQSQRWETLASLIESGAEFPEKPLLDALLYRLKADEGAAMSAVTWSKSVIAGGITNATDLRLASLVYDWCHDVFPADEQLALRGAMATALETLLPQANLDVGLIRAGILAAIAIAGEWEGSEAALGQLIDIHWQAQVEEALNRGELADDGAALIAVLEVCHAVRYNLDVDLWRRSPDAIQTIARTRLLSYYPLDIETPEGRARRPSIFGDDEVTARIQAPLYRIAETLLVAYEGNSQEFQFLQGWLRNDRYSLRSPTTAIYEFLWVNPYLPGLTPQSSPRLAHDFVRGRLYGRNNWEETDIWIGYVNGRLEIYADRQSSFVSAARKQAPLLFPGAAVVLVRPPVKLNLAIPEGEGDPLSNGKVYLIGLNPGDTYGIRINGRQPQLMNADPGGIVVIYNDPYADKRNVINFQKKLKIDVKRTLKPTDPRRGRPSLRP